MEYFILAEKVKKGTAMACSVGEVPPLHLFVKELKDKLEFPFELVFQKSTIVKGRWQPNDDISDLTIFWTDFILNDRALPFMSEKMKEIIDHNLTGNEGVAWMQIGVNLLNERRIYYLPRFEKKLDVLDLQKTIFVESSGLVLKPTFSKNKVANLSIFHLPDFKWEMPSGLYVNEIVKKEMQKAKLTGVGFESARVE
ncbi:MAG: hypothetical protein PHV20_07075 [Bacteroidales bacterium]|nr:hypothetical protein [Bacteroidales bacterium]